MHTSLAFANAAEVQLPRRIGQVHSGRDEIVRQCPGIVLRSHLRSGSQQQREASTPPSEVNVTSQREIQSIVTLTSCPLPVLFCTMVTTSTDSHAPKFDPDYFPARPNLPLNAGRYKILRKLGEGVSSSTWVVHDATGEQVSQVPS